MARPVLILALDGVGPGAPVNTVAPVVSSADLFVGTQASCTEGTWTTTGTPSFAYQWERDGSPIGGATNSTYTFVEDDIGADISCVVTCTDDGGSTPAESNEIGPVEAVPAETVFIEGFDYYTAVASGSAQVDDRWTLSSTSGQLLVAGRYGGLAIRSGNTSAVTYLAGLPATYTGVSAGFAIRFNDTIRDNGANVFSFRLSGSGQYGINFIANGTVEIRGQAGAVMASSSAGAVSPDTWHYIETEYLCANADGFMRVYVDGTLAVSYTGDTQIQASAGANQIRFQFQVNSADSVDVDDVYVADGTTALGPSRVTTLLPNASGSAGFGWTTVGADMAAAIGEAQANGDTSYIEADEDGIGELAFLSALGYAPTAIYAAQTSITARSAGISTFLQVGLWVNNVLAADPLSSTTYAVYRDLFPDDGAGGEWTAVKLAGVQLDGNTDLRITQAAVEVLTSIATE